MNEILAVVGSRSFDDYETLKATLSKRSIDKIVSGGAIGADSLAARYAKENGIELIEFLPDWKKYGKTAGFLRNKQIIDAATHVIAFWDGNSRGTQHSMNLAKLFKKPLEVIRF
jgi:hypothetical protein